MRPRPPAGPRDGVTPAGAMALLWVSLAIATVWMPHDRRGSTPDSGRGAAPWRKCATNIDECRYMWHSRASMIIDALRCIAARHHAEEVTRDGDIVLRRGVLS